MDFYLAITKKSILNIEHRYVETLQGIQPSDNTLYIAKLPHLDYFSNAGDSQTWMFGDIVEYKVNNMLDSKGFYYYIKFDFSRAYLEIQNDYHGFLPIYYTEDSTKIIVSSSIDTIANCVHHKTPNHHFVTDIALFNVSLGNQCFWNEIKRVEYGSKIVYSDGKLKFIQGKRFYDLFASSPKPYKRAIEDVVESFIFNGKSYFDRPSNISLTGGFDGRAVTGLAHYSDSDFHTYSYGKEDNSDVSIPMMLAKKLNFPYRHIKLAEEYVRDAHLKHVREYLKQSGGMNGFLYPHIPYGTSQLSADNRAIITGYCGSELLRNPHFGGAISSQVAIDLLSLGKDKALANAIGNSDYIVLGADYISENCIKKSIDIASSYLLSLPRDLTRNQKLAVFEFEEVIPKLFGTLIYMGLRYARTRAPFVDVDFYKLIATTEISQFYRKFMEQNPTKRFSGQLLYARILEITWPALGKLNSGKGYAPADLLSLFGKARITYGYLGKKKRAAKVTFDNLGLVSGVREYIKHSDSNADIDSTFLDGLLRNQHKRDLLFLRLSASEYKKMYLENNQL